MVIYDNSSNIITQLIMTWTHLSGRKLMDGLTNCKVIEVFAITFHFPL